MEYTIKHALSGKLPKEGDKVKICGKTLTIRKCDGYFLFDKDFVDNSWIFDELGIEDKEEWVECIIQDETLDGDFPEVPTIEEFKELLLALWDLESSSKYAKLITPRKKTVKIHL